MAEPTRIDALLLQYEELRAQDAEITPDELCRDCPELLGELKRRIQDLAAVDAWLNRETSPQSETDWPAPGSVGLAAPAAEALATEMHYRILRRFAQGGLGEVLLAEDEHLHRPIALKRMHGLHAHNPDSRRRFAREAEITSRLEHPNVVPVHTVGQDREGRPFYTMRYIEGQTLEEAIRQFYQADQPGRDPAERRLALRQLLGRFVAVCNTIAYAHSRGIIHRDIKPSNIMLGSYGETLVVDWGLAKLWEQGSRESSLRPQIRQAEPEDSFGETQQGTVIGTPAYMSPEQAQGQISRIGPRSDVYGLGATLYTVLTGKAPYEGREIGAVVEAVNRGECLTPRRLRPEIPRALEAICLKAMARNPGRRYATALELAADVERWLADDPVSAWREPWSVGVRRWLGRHRTALAAVAAASIVGVLSLGLFNLSLQATNTELQAAQQSLQTTNTELQAAKQSLLTRNAELQAANAREREAQRAAEGLLTHLLVVASGLSSLRVEGTGQKQLLQSSLANYEHFSAGHAQDPNLKAQLAFLHLNLGFMAQRTGSSGEALAEFLKCCRILEPLHQREPANIGYRHRLAQGYLQAGASYVELGKREEALQHYQQAHRLFGELVRSDPNRSEPNWWIGLSECYHNMATVIPDVTQNVNEALDYFHKAIVIQQDIKGDAPGQWALLAQSYDNLGGLQERLNLRMEALGSFHAGWDLRVKLVELRGHEPRAVCGLADSALDLGRMYRRIDPQQARAHFETARDLCEKVLKKGHEDRRFQYYLEDKQIQHYLAKSHLALGSLEQEASRLQKAGAAVQEAEKILKRLAKLDPGNQGVQYDLAICHYHYGRLASAAGQHKKANREFAEVVDRINAFQELRQGKVYIVRRALSLAYLGKHAAATEEAEGAAQRGPQMRHSLYDLARVFALSIPAAWWDGREDLAEQYTQKALLLLREAQKTAAFRTLAEIAWLENDPDLQALHGLAEFKSLLAEVKHEMAALLGGVRMVGSSAVPFGPGPWVAVAAGIARPTVLDQGSLPDASR